MNPRKALETLRAYRAGASLGDVVVLKLDAYSPPTQRVARMLEPLRGYVSKHDLPALRALPAGTLGREYARFLDANGIEPLAISTDVQDRFRENPYVLRYTTTHDLHHTLTGFDAGITGEAGVLGFYVGQGSAPISRALLWVAQFVYALLSPTQARRIWHNVRIGLALGADAELVMAQPLESWFGEPLGEVRAKLRIPDPRSAGVLPSGGSFVWDRLYPRKPAV